jgi:hypothetical protein
MIHCRVKKAMRGDLKNRERRFALKQKDDYDRYCSEGVRKVGVQDETVLCCAEQQMQITCSWGKVRALTQATR